MKKITQFLLLAIVMGGMSACLENPNLTYTGSSVVEFNTSVITAPAAGRTYPLLSVSNGAGIQTTRINLVGAQRPTDQIIKVAVDPALSNAVAGTHYKIVNENVTIPANSSFGDLQIEILRVPPQTGTTLNLVVTIEGNAETKPSENYKRLGWAIRL